MKQFINKILMLLNSIGKDKYQHECLGGWIFLISFGLLFIFMPALWASSIAFAIVFTAALIKDIVIDDYADLVDIFATMLGALKIYIPILLLI